MYDNHVRDIKKTTRADDLGLSNEYADIYHGLFYRFMERTGLFLKT